MNKSMNAVIVFYNGSPITPSNVEVPATIAQLLCNYGLVEDKDSITIVAKDVTGIMNALLRDNVEISDGPRVININKPVDSKIQDATIEAIKLIGKMFAESLIVGKNTSNYGPFMRDLLMHRDDTLIRNAIKVVAESNASVPKKLFRDYNITSGAIETIRDANNTLL